MRLAKRVCLAGGFLLGACVAAAPEAGSGAGKIAGLQQLETGSAYVSGVWLWGGLPYDSTGAGTIGELADAFEGQVVVVDRDTVATRLNNLSQLRQALPDLSAYLWSSEAPTAP